MKFSTSTFAGLLLLATSAAAYAAPAEEIQSTSVTSNAMAELRQLKVETRERERKKGSFKKGKYNSKKNRNVSKCKNGLVDGEYGCKNVNLHGFLSHEDMGSVVVS